MKNKTILLTTLAEYQTEYWIKVAQKLAEKEVKVIFLSFDDRSSEMLDNANFTQYNIPALAKNINLSESKKLKNFDYSQINKWLLHEKITFNIRDSRTLEIKFLSYINVLNEIIKSLKLNYSNLVLLQELGGFISVIASYFSAMENEIDNFFLEPSFFKGKLFFTRNSFVSPNIGSNIANNISDDVSNYLDTVTRNHEIVIPKKDRHQYKSSFSKIISFKKLKRLIEKIIDKYIFSKHQEFAYIGHYIKIHLKAAFNSFALKNYYTSINKLDKFIYFPLHVPGDAALTIRSTEFLDQITLIEYLASRIPSKFKLAIKEHPAQIGAMDRQRLKNALKKFDNIKLISPKTNNYNVILKSDFLVTINSKSGAEAMLLSKPVIVLGDAFYKDSPLIIKVNHVNEIEHAFLSAINKNSFSKDEIYRYFQTVWNKTYDGELYVDNESDIEAMSLSIKNGLLL